MVTVRDVMLGSLADKNGIKSGDYIIRINGHDINDVLDYRYYLSNSKVVLTVHRGADIFDVVIKKDQYSDIGLEFDSFLMDDHKSCRNKCIFCFIDQLPHGMRDSLYFKDDDSRLSFLMGNYITMTNMSDSDIDRIVNMKMSPINISVHTTNPALRCMMLNNRNAGDVMDRMRRLAKGGVEMNCQIVLCKGINDGEELTRTMEDLASLYPSVRSVSVVPAGLTKHRANLFPLTTYSADECRSIISKVGDFARKCFSEVGSRIFFCADEFYTKARVPIPKEEQYEGYPQIENGVGLIRSLEVEFSDAMSSLEGVDIYKRYNVSIATGDSAYEFISTLVERIRQVFCNFRCKVYRINNDFFGDEVTVAGLLTGYDIYRQLRGRHLGERLFLPSVMLRREGGYVP